MYYNVKTFCLVNNDSDFDLQIVTWLTKLQKDCKILEVKAYPLERKKNIYSFLTIIVKLE